MSDLDIDRLDWDSSFFGFEIGRASGSTFGQGDQKVVQRAKEAGIKCLYFLVDADSAETLAAMHSFGCRFVDGRLCLSRKLDSATEVSVDESGVRPALDEDNTELVEICESIDWDTRFFKDSGFPVDRSRQMYSKWIARDLEKESVFVAPDPANNEIPGFLSYSIDEDERKAVIQLLAVRDKARGQGIADRLLSAAIRQTRALGAVEAEVVTQSSNIPAQRLYQKHGFRSSSLKLWFHLWL